MDRTFRGALDARMGALSESPDVRLLPFRLIPSYPCRSNVENCTPDGRLPDADKGADHIRNIFYRMGFNDEEIVALSGAHALGRCHTDRSGFDGPWQVSFQSSTLVVPAPPDALTRMTISQYAPTTFS